MDGISSFLSLVILGGVLLIVFAFGYTRSEENKGNLMTKIIKPTIYVVGLSFILMLFTLSR